MNDTHSREEICKIGASLYARGFVHASAGNISIKLPDGSFLITPTDACLGSLVSQDLAHVSAAGEQLSGLRASKTIILHRSIYESEPHATCVIHAHCTNLVSLTLQGVWQESAIIPPITPYFVMKVGRIPWVAYHRPGDPKVAIQVKNARSFGTCHLAQITFFSKRCFRRVGRNRKVVATFSSSSRAIK